MAHSLRVLPVAVPNSAGTLRSPCSSRSSEVWQPTSFVRSRAVPTRWSSDANKVNALVKFVTASLSADDFSFGTLRLVVRPVESGRLSMRVLKAAVEGTFPIREPCAESAADEEIAVEEFVPMVERSASNSALQQQKQSTGRFRPRYPGKTQGRPDITVLAESLRRGAVFKGIVSSIQPYGAFVNFGAFADGLVHISKLSAGYVRNVSDIVAVGQEVTVSIVNVEQSSGRISLSMLATDERDARKPYVSPRQEGASRQQSKRPLFQPGFGRIAHAVVENEQIVSWNAQASSRPGELRNGGGRHGRISRHIPEKDTRFSKMPFTSSRQGKASEEEAKSRFQPGSVSTVDEEEQKAREFFSLSRVWDVPEGDSSPRSRQGNDGKFLTRRKITGVANGTDREEQKKPKMKLVQVQNRETVEGVEGSTTVDKSNSHMRMRSWYECDCC